MEINRELSKRQFMQKENDYHHSPYETELEFYSAVRAGDLETVKRLYTPQNKTPVPFHMVNDDSHFPFA